MPSLHLLISSSSFLLLSLPISFLYNPGDLPMPSLHLPIFPHPLIVSHLSSLPSTWKSANGISSSSHLPLPSYFFPSIVFTFIVEICRFHLLISLYPIFPSLPILSHLFFNLHLVAFPASILPFPYLRMVLPLPPLCHFSSLPSTKPPLLPFLHLPILLLLLLFPLPPPSLFHLPSSLSSWRSPAAILSPSYLCILPPQKHANVKNYGERYASYKGTLSFVIVNVDLHIDSQI